MHRHRERHDQAHHHHRRRGGGYLLKGANQAEILRAVTAVAHGEAIIRARDAGLGRGQGGSRP
ncbi:hypothetical protein [Microbispora catharanthi]|uniref:hypothetical protein n=1 Tax=Microbispora catharanthi TaxID=1712871 RepID=UPI00197BDAD8|nr:hypothetical protein [Microbispora catharanthi]